MSVDMLYAILAPQLCQNPQKIDLNSMVTIYQNYGDEPKDIFLPLPEDLACEFYALEMDSYTADIDCFETLLPRQGSFLELGCGTGRIASRLAGPGRFIVGIDISFPMLQLATQGRQPSKNSVSYLCMDMVHLAFSVKFDAILIPYNTLNLLGSEDKIITCLNCCKNSLRSGGSLQLQIFIPTEDFIQQKKTFQFQIFNRPKGGKIIKEILKQYDPESLSVHIEERYRVRPGQLGAANEDWNSCYTIAGFSAEHWFSIFSAAGFVATNFHGDYFGSPYHKSTSSCLVTTLTLQ